MPAGAACDFERVLTELIAEFVDVEIASHVPNCYGERAAASIQ
jgi:hypothetical protein